MELKITREELAKRSIFLGLPCYGGNCNAAFARSIADLSSICTAQGIKLQMYFLMNESLIQRARNYIADEFMRSDCTHLMFIDSDIGFNANDVLFLLALASEDSPYDIIGAAYPKKAISWEKVMAAANAGVADENPNVLENFVGDYVFNPKAGTNSFPINQPVEVLEIGTGFMMVQKRVFQNFVKTFPEKLYKPDHARTEHFDGSREICAYFDCVIDPVSKRYLSEDYYFCIDSQTRIETENGIRTIKWIVDNKYFGKVKSLDVNGRFVWNSVTAHWSRANGKRGISETKKKWLKMNTSTDNKTKSKLICTDDHRVFTIDDVFNPIVCEEIPAKDTVGKFIVRQPVIGQKSKNENPLFNKEQLQVLFGSMMGDASIGKNGQLLINHGSNQFSYNQFKASILGGTVGSRMSPKFDKDYQKLAAKMRLDMIEANTMRTPVNAQTKVLRDVLYSTGKKRIEWLLPRLDELSLAFWYMDDGCLDKKSMALATHGFDYEEHLAMQKMCKERFGVDAKIDYTKTTTYRGEKRRYYGLRFGVEDTKILHEKMAPYIHESMHYKLLKVFHDIPKHIFDMQPLEYAASYVKSLTYLPKHSSRLYDIEVEDTHNFVADGTIVHNCQKIQEMGMKTWLCPWMNLQHVGSYTFGGSLAALASIKASATVDPNKISKVAGNVIPPPKKALSLPAPTTAKKRNKKK